MDSKVIDCESVNLIPVSLDGDEWLFELLS
jgi:hypothetical protein